jgi:hypothetical protein
MKNILIIKEEYCQIWSGGPSSNLGRRAASLSFFVVFLSPSRRMLECTLQLGHDRILSHPFKFIIHLSLYHSTLYI